MALISVGPSACVSMAEAPTTTCRSTYCDTESWCQIRDLWQDDRQVYYRGDKDCACRMGTSTTHRAASVGPPHQKSDACDVVDVCASINLRQRCYLTCVHMLVSLRATTVYDMVESVVVSQSAITLYVDGVCKIISKTVSRSGFHKWSTNVPYCCHFTN